MENNRQLALTFKDGATKTVNLDWKFKGRPYSAVDFNSRGWVYERNYDSSDLIHYEDLNKDNGDISYLMRKRHFLVMYKKNGFLYWAEPYNGEVSLIMNDIYDTNRWIFASPRQVFAVMESKNAFKYLQRLGQL